MPTDTWKFPSTTCVIVKQVLLVHWIVCFWKEISITFLTQYMDNMCVPNIDYLTSLYSSLSITLTNIFLSLSSHATGLWIIPSLLLYINAFSWDIILLHSQNYSWLEYNSILRVKADVKYYRNIVSKNNTGYWYFLFSQISSDMDLFIRQLDKWRAGRKMTPLCFRQMFFYIYYSKKHD